MGRAASLCGVILAAGDSTRMGTDKALLPWPPVSAGHVPVGSFLSAAIQSLAFHTDLVIVVAGKNAASLAPVIYGAGAFMVVNPDSARGQFSSLQTGLQEVLNRGRDAAMVTLVDRPPVQEVTIKSLTDAFVTALDHYQWAVVPQIHGKHGHPFIAAREMIEEFLKAPPASTAREIEHRCQEKIVYIDVDDPMTVANVNTPAEYSAIAPASR